MKRLICLMLLAVSTTPSAFSQGLTSSITSFDSAQGVVWSNTVTNAYSMVEWTPLLTGVWNPFNPPGECVTGGVGRIEGWSNVWGQLALAPMPLFFRIRSSESVLTNITETTRLRVSNRTGSVVSNLFLQVKSHEGWWVDDWTVLQVQPGQTTEYNDFVIQWEPVMTSWVGYLSGSYQTTGQTASVWLNPWPYPRHRMMGSVGHQTDDRKP